MKAHKIETKQILTANNSINEAIFAVRAHVSEFVDTSATHTHTARPLWAPVNQSVHDPLLFLSAYLFCNFMFGPRHCVWSLPANFHVFY